QRLPIAVEMRLVRAQMRVGDLDDLQGASPEIEKRERLRREFPSKPALLADLFRRPRCQLGNGSFHLFSSFVTSSSKRAGACYMPN
ncbi:hypothetical protein, partial [Rhizobium sp.]|uniref:hypothetical protein n=1 Tax=Rhizobium sp. TaxID=391 RepID=UPI002EF16768